MFAALVAKIIAFLAGKGLDVTAKVSPFLLTLAPAGLMLLSGLAFYFSNRASAANLVLAAIEAVSEAIVAAQIANAAK